MLRTPFQPSFSRVILVAAGGCLTIQGLDATVYFAFNINQSWKSGTEMQNILNYTQNSATIRF
jgi:hypothetical protein